jgi:hypothetical protein
MSPFPRTNPDDLALPITLPPKTGQAIVVAGVMGLLCLIGFLKMLGGSSTGFLMVIGFGICALAFGSSLIPGACYLRLDRDGITDRFLFRETSFKWSDIESIFVVEQKTLGFIVVQRYVGINFTPEYGKSKIARKFARTFGAAEALIRTNGWKAAQLVELLNRCHRQLVATRA